jgi:hypothetical protein
MGGGFDDYKHFRAWTVKKFKLPVEAKNVEDVQVFSLNGLGEDTGANKNKWVLQRAYHCFNLPKQVLLRIPGNQDYLFEYRYR